MLFSHFSLYIQYFIGYFNWLFFIKILSDREYLDVNSQRTQKCTFHLDFRGERVENKEEHFIMMLGGGGVTPIDWDMGCAIF